MQNVEVVRDIPQEANVIERTQSKAASISIGIHARAVSAEKIVSTELLGYTIKHPLHTLLPLKSEQSALQDCR